MKRKPHFNLLVFFILILLVPFSSCTNEDLLSEIIAQNEAPDPSGENPTDPTDPTPPVSTDALKINTTPCDYTLASLSANETLKVACQLDLGGQTIALPANVILEYDGGEIINGALTFNGGKIDGDLLNQKLEVSGTVILIDPIFTFHPERWDIVQGQTNSDRAQKNNNNLENLMDATQKIGASTFTIDEFDAYFEISKVTSTTTNQNYYPSLEAINIPSDFNLIMTDNTHLRTYPNNGEAGVLIAFREVSNSSIQGGTLHGERDEHDYSNISAGEGGNHLMHIHAANNIIVDGVKMIMGSKGGLHISSLRFTFQPDYLPSHNIKIENCTFDSNRRMAVALTDGFDILFQNNTFIDTALDRPNSDGGVVGFAVNIEAVRTRDTNGDLVLYERVYNVDFVGNKERGSRVGAFNIYTGEYITVENNDFENKVNWSYASNAKIINNRFVASAVSKSMPAINAGGSGETVYDNEISGNSISGYDLAISAYYKDIQIFDNTVENFITGIQLKDASDMNIYNNILKSNLASSRGISFHLTSVNNVEIRANEIDVAKDQLYFVSLNQGEEDLNNRVTVTNNKFLSGSKITFSNAKGISFDNNEVIGGLQLINTSDVILLDNTITSESSHGVHLRGNSFNISIGDNQISVPNDTNFQCIKDDSEVKINLGETNTCL